MEKRNPSERGQVLVIVAFGLIAMIALVALSVDGGNAYSDRRRAQNAADSSVLAAALAMIRAPSTVENAIAIGQARALEEGFDNDGTSNIVELYSPPISGLYACDGAEGSLIIPDSDPPTKTCTQYVQAFITSTVKTYFAPLIGVNEVTNKVEAVARAIGSIAEPIYGGSAIAAMNDEACKAMIFQGSADVVLEGSGMYVNSSCEDAAFFNHSKGGSLTAPCLVAVGGIEATEKVNVPASCKLENQEERAGPNLPNIVCTDNAKVDGEWMYPGNWDGKGNKDFPPAGVRYLQSGIYCIHNADFKVNSTTSLLGIDVLIYMIDGGVEWNGASYLHLDAPGGEDDDCTADAGPFKGLLIYVDQDNDSTVRLNGGSDSEVEGTILAPASNCELKGGGSVTAPLQAQLVCDTVDLSGNQNIYIKYNPCVLFEPPSNPTLQMTK